MSPNRYEYRLDLAAYQPPAAEPLPPGFTLRNPNPADLLALAELMLESYRDTIDYGGETLDDARGEIQGYLSSADDEPPLLDASFLLHHGNTLACASLVKTWKHRNSPIVSYVMSRPEWKGRGLARIALAHTLATLKAHPHPQVRAVVTEGNTPSERLIARAGFLRI